MTREFIPMTGQGTTSTFVESPLQINFFMQNKPNFPKAKIKLNLYLTKDYEHEPPLRQPAKQTQFKPNSKPIKPNFTSADSPSIRRSLESKYKRTLVLRVAKLVLQAGGVRW
jgi:hypothetical protein